MGGSSRNLAHTAFGTLTLLPQLYEVRRRRVVGGGDSRNPMKITIPQSTQRRIFSRTRWDDTPTPAMAVELHRLSGERDDSRSTVSFLKENNYSRRLHARKPQLSFADERTISQSRLNGNGTSELRNVSRGKFLLGDSTCLEHRECADENNSSIRT